MMKAAVIYRRGEMPQYKEVDEPVIQNSDELLVTVKAAAIKHFDKSKANGKHYTAGAVTEKPVVIGGDCIGLLPDGTRVFAMGTSGTIAEKATIEKNRMVKLPAGIDDATAAALPNAVAGSAMAILFRAKMQPAETILINGATGFTGTIAVQVAKHYGAGRIIVTGRNEATLQSLKALGADETISISQDDDNFIAQVKAIHAVTPIDVMIDYLWGHTAELLLASLKGKGAFTPRTRFVSIGAVTGDTIQLSAENLRSVDLQLSGSGLGSWTKEEIQNLFAEILPVIFQLAADGKIRTGTVTVNFRDIEKIWDMNMPGGKRLVVMM